MSRVPNTSKAREFQTHVEGGPYPFKIIRVEEFTSKNNTTGYPDKYKMRLNAAGESKEGHCNMTIFPLKDDMCFELKMLCEAVGLSTDGGWDSEEFVGKFFQAEVYQFPWKDGKLAALKPKTIAAYENEESDLPF